MNKICQNVIHHPSLLPTIYTALLSSSLCAPMGSDGSNSLSLYRCIFHVSSILPIKFSSSSVPEDIREHLLVNVERADGLAQLPAVIKLSVQNLTRLSDTGEPILSRVNLDIPSGLIVRIIGPSGSGKSTLLRALNRLWEPSPNTVFLDNQDICQLHVLSLHRRVGMLFQLPALFTGIVADNIRYGPRLRGKKLTNIEVQNLLSVTDLDPSLASKPASDLSVGQAQRIALARTLANDPEVLLLDEPTCALDPISTKNIEAAMLHLKKSQRMTMVMVSQSVKQIQRIADLVCLLVDGEILLHIQWHVVSLSLASHSQIILH